MAPNKLPNKLLLVLLSRQLKSDTAVLKTHQFCKCCLSFS